MAKSNKFILELNKASNEMRHFQYATTDKFSDDKIHIESDDLLLIIDGVILNKKELVSKSSDKDWKSVVRSMYLNNKATFFTQLSGSYWGIALDKVNGHLVAFSDHTGSKPMFYSHNDTSLIVSNNSFDLTSYLKEHKSIKPTLNITSAFLLLDFGYSVEENTIINEVKRIRPGNFLLLENSKERTVEFHKIKKEPRSISDRDAVEGIDYHFRKSVQETFDKDLEYGYRHLVALSGGLDSRMTSFVAHEMGYTDQCNITFSQSDALDEKIAKKISSDLKHEWIFKSLDNGTFLKEIDKVTKLTGGNISYFGIAHGLSLLENMDFTHFGMLHSGQCGNSIVSTFGNHESLDKQFNLSELARHTVTKKHLSDFQLSGDYHDFEMYKNYNHCLIAGNNGALPAQSKSETISPFYNLDFWTFCLSIPTEQRAHHRLYKLWVNEKYPEAAKYTWEDTKVPVNSKFPVKIKGKSYSAKQLWKIAGSKTVQRLAPSRKQGIYSKSHMNPIEYWFETNSDLADFYMNYLKESIGGLDQHPELKEHVLALSKNGLATDYAKILSLLSIVRFIES